MSYENDTPITLPINFQDDVDSPLAQHQNDQNAEIAAIRNALGTASQLKGGKSSLALRLAEIMELELLKHLVTGAAKNLAVKNNASNPNSQIDVDADQLILTRPAGGSKLVSGVDLTIDIATVGAANGLDTGSEASNAWYYVWVINNGSITAGLLSASSSNPTMPSGYTFKALVGAVRNDGSSNFLKVRQMGKRVYYEAGQSAYSNATPGTNEVTVSLSSFVPPNAAKILLRVSAVLAAGATIHVRFVSGSNYFTLQAFAGSATRDGSFVEIPNVGQQVFFQISTSNDVAIDVVGYEVP